MKNNHPQNGGYSPLAAASAAYDSVWDMVPGGPVLIVKDRKDKVLLVIKRLPSGRYEVTTVAGKKSNNLTAMCIWQKYLNRLAHKIA